MKTTKFFLALILSSLTLSSCGNIGNPTSSNSSFIDQLFDKSSARLSKAQAFFIEENQYMSEREALSKEIDYYRAPNIIRAEKLGELDGKALIHIANVIRKEDDEKPMTSFGGSSPMKFVRRVEDIKEYALNHPNKPIAELYVFGGDFVHFNKGITRKWKMVVFIPETNRFIEVSGDNIAGISIYGFSADGYEWLSNLPAYEDRTL